MLRQLHQILARVQIYSQSEWLCNLFLFSYVTSLSLSLSLSLSIPTISEDVARNALMDEIGQHCCYGKGAAQNLVFTNIQPSSAFHVSYILLTPKIFMYTHLFFLYTHTHTHTHTCMHSIS